MKIVQQKASEANIALRSQKAREPMNQTHIDHSTTLSSSPSEVTKGTTMKKTAIAALFAPSLALLLVLAIFVSSHAAAQTGPNLMVANAHCNEDTMTAEHNLGYVSFVAGTNGVQATVSTTQAVGGSPFFKTFHVTGGTSQGLHHVTAGTSGVGFEALHAYTNLSEIIDYYWNTFVGFGYIATMDSFSPESMVYTFDNGVSRYEAVFTAQGDDIGVSFTPVPTLFASR